MKTIMFIMGAAAIALTLNGCNGTKRAATSAVQELSGIYTGILPCADCPGIQTRVDINGDMTYKLQTRYIGKSDKTADVFNSSGKFKWNAADNTITFDNKLLGQCLSEGGMLYLLVDGKKEAGENAKNYVLMKVDTDLVEKYWKLIELYGNPVAAPVNGKEAHIIFEIDGNRFNGDAGCNRMLGTYQLTGGGRIILSPTATTLMMCLNMDVENKFLEVLKTADSYIIRNDTLSLNRARMAPLARFAAIKK
jgi:heat shock protein HslJ